MYNNFKKKRMWQVSESTSVEVYERNMDELRVYNEAAYQHLLGAAPKEKWVKAYFSGHAKCDTQVNNF